VTASPPVIDFTPGNIANELRKMIDFYHTQDLSRIVKEKADLFSLANIVIRYDPTENAIQIVKVDVYDDEVSLRPKYTKWPMPRNGH
jgi:hypothetical protein